MSRQVLLLALAAAAVGCTGYLQGESLPAGPTTGTAGTDPGGATTPQTDPNQPPTAQVTCAPGASETVGHRVLRRLTNLELETSVRAWFGLNSAQWPGVNLPSDAGSSDGFNNNVDSLTVGPDYVKGTLDGAKKIATLVTTEPLLTQLLPCSSAGDAACADALVASWGAKLYRRPVTAAEKARYQALYSKVTAQEDFRSFAYWATIAMLQSPHVIYRSELGDADGRGRFQLTQHEIATQLAYTFTGAPPSAALTALAESNQLATADQIETAARGLVFDAQTIRPAFRDILLRFSDQWLGLGGLSNLKKDATLYPGFGEQVQASMAEETRRFFSSVVLDERGGVGSILTAPYTFVDGTLAQYYGFGAASGTDFTRVMRPATWGVGLLAQGAFLSVQANSLATSPTRRGHMIRGRLLCEEVPPPPAVVGEIPAPTAAKTTRERYETLHTANPGCKGCHAMMDNLGFALEHLDAAGRYRETENGVAIDDSGSVTGTSSGDLAVSGAAGLSGALAALPEVTDCVSAYLAAYALGLNHQSAQCLATTAASELRAGGSVLDYYVDLARSEHFRARQ